MVAGQICEGRSVPRSGACGRPSSRTEIREIVCRTPVRQDGQPKTQKRGTFCPSLSPDGFVGYNKNGGRVRPMAKRSWLADGLITGLAGAAATTAAIAAFGQAEDKSPW